MFNKNNVVALCLIFLFAITIISAVKPVSSVDLSNKGLSVEPTEKSAIRYEMNHSFEVHVFNISDGMPITSGITCYMHLYHKTGKHIYEGVQDTADHTFDYGFDLESGNFTDRGEYQAKFQCNNSQIGGASQLFFLVNGFGEELGTSYSIKFNASMFFLLIFFLLAVIGCFISENYIAKFTLYWVAHLIFIAGNFAIWQFNQGYTTQFVGSAVVWKVMFYIATISAFPMLLLSLAWIFYIHTFNEHMQKLVDKGEDPERAFTIANKKSGGWAHGK